MAESALGYQHSHLCHVRGLTLPIYYLANIADVDLKATKNITLRQNISKLPLMGIMSVDSRPRFQHKPLPANMIRLLRLKSRKHSPDIECEILHCEREDDYKYIALSYCWGREGENEDILVNGSRCTVSARLKEALQYLQNEKDDNLYWIDQLCINQEDDEEKSEQVGEMASIYEQAQGTVAWLGKSDDDLDLLLILFGILAEQEVKVEELPAVSSLQIVANRLEAYNKQKETAVEDSSAISILQQVVEKWKTVFKQQDFMSPWDEERILARLSSAFDDFCGRDYWKRTWVLQEFALATYTVVCCGPLQIPHWALQAAWEVIWRVQERFDLEKGSIGQLAKRAFTAPTMSFVSGILTRRQRYQEDCENDEDPDSLFLVMACNLVMEGDYNQVQVSDARDLVFALMGLCSDSNEFPEFPDYSMSTAKVYEILARRFLEQGNIDNLAHCQFPQHLDGESLPTWAPDWSMNIRCTIMGHESEFEASGPRTQSDRTFTENPNPKSVTLEGVVVNDIAELGGEWDPDWLKDLDVDAALEYLKDIWRLRSLSSGFRENSTLFDCARWAIADYDRYADEDFPENFEVKWPEAFASLTDDKELETVFCNLIDSEIYANLLKRLHSRRPFISESGWVGLAPSHGMKGDRIVIFLGGQAAYIIRATDASTYTIVGEAYVHGIMYGEFMTDDVKVECFDLV